MAIRKPFLQKILIGLGVLAVVALLLMVALSGGNWELLKSLFAKDLSNEELSQQLMRFGWRGYTVISALAALQVVCTFLPAEPVQVLAGFTFGFPLGLLCCMIGVLLGKEADHSVGGGRQEIEKENNKGGLAGAGDLFQIHIQLLDEEVPQPVTEYFLQ